MKTPKTNVLSCAILIACCLITTSVYASEPECFALIDRQIEDANKGINKLKEKKNSGSPQSVLDRDMMRFESTISGLKGHVESCKKENPSADFSKIDQRVSTSIKAYDGLKSGAAAEQKKNASKKTWMDVNQYKSYLRTHPSGTPMKLDYTKSFIFSREDVVNAQKSGDGPLKKALAEFIELLTSDENKKNFMGTINASKSSLTTKDVKVQVEAKAELEGLIKDLKHLQDVFAPKDPNLSALISEAQNALK